MNYSLKQAVEMIISPSIDEFESKGNLKTDIPASDNIENVVVNIQHQSNQFDKDVILTNGYLFDKEADTATVKLEPLSPILDENFTRYIEHVPLCPNNDQNSCKVNLAVNVEPQSSEFKGNLTVKIEPLSFECGQNMTVETELQSSKDFENMTIRTEHSSPGFDNKVTVKEEPHSPVIDDAAETDVVEDVKLKTDEDSTEYNSDNTIKIEPLFIDKVWSSERLSTDEKLATVTNQPTEAMIQHCGSDKYLYTPGVTAYSETSTGTDTTSVLLNRDTAESCDMDSKNKTINLNTQINSNDKEIECQENGTNNTIHHNKVIKRKDLVKGRGRFFTVENNTFRCLLCGKKFYLYFQYENHALRKHFPFSCILCDFCFQTKADAMSHTPCTKSHTTCKTSHTPYASSNTLCTTKQHTCSVCNKTFQKGIDLLKHCKTCVNVSGRGKLSSLQLRKDDRLTKKTSHTFHKTMPGKAFDESDIAPVELTKKTYHRKEVILVDHVDSQVETSLPKSKKKNTFAISTCYKTMSGKIFDESDVAPAGLTKKKSHRKKVILVDNQVETSFTKSKKKNPVAISTRDKTMSEKISDESDVAPAGLTKKKSYIKEIMLVDNQVDTSLGKSKKKNNIATFDKTISGKTAYENCLTQNNNPILKETKCFPGFQVRKTSNHVHSKSDHLLEEQSNVKGTSFVVNKDKSLVEESWRKENDGAMNQTGHDITYSDQELEQTDKLVEDVLVMNVSKVNNLMINESNGEQSIKCSVCRFTFPTIISLLKHSDDCDNVSGRDKVNVKDFSQEVEYFEASARKLQRINHKRKLEETEEQCWEAEKFNKYQKSLNKLVTQFTFSEDVHYTVLITGSYKCKICSENFKCLPSFSSHAKSQHFPFQCSICPAFFTTMDGLKQHSKGCIYIMGKGYCCTMCRKIFPAQNELKAHTLLNHTVYICFKCNCEFENQRKLDLHSQTCRKIRIQVL
ncbi:PRDM5 [Mytilus coruscus]|uniref:PRDM5 n=1 Tax=Mytilus coruscus TaxID=42192 RepID=A0A6J8A5P4_MYTCO|nr:PRDM5 [Mytilus coruscus]